jgi:hypothetical protein
MKGKGGQGRNGSIKEPLNPPEVPWCDRKLVSKSPG